MTIGGGGSAYLSAGGTMLSPTIQDSGTLTALGTITGVATDNGLIYVPAGVLTLNGLAGTGELTIANGANVAMKGNANLANLVVNAGGTLQVHGVTVDTDPLTIDAGGTIIGDGVIGGSITDDGFITVSGGVLQFTGAINGPGTITIDGGATLLLDGAVNSGVTIDFNSDGSGTLEEADPSGMQGTIMGEQPGDVVENATCYLAGTRISTSDGDRAIETLMAGDLVQAHFAGMTPVQWIGYRRIDCHRHPNPRKVWPVQVAAGAFGEQSPRRDLCLSPDHAVFVDGVLIPIKHLINGTTIEQVPMDTITYYHLELSEHDVLLADGLPAEFISRYRRPLEVRERRLGDHAASGFLHIRLGGDGLRATRRVWTRVERRTAAVAGTRSSDQRERRNRKPRRDFGHDHEPTVPPHVRRRVTPPRTAPPRPCRRRRTS